MSDGVHSLPNVSGQGVEATVDDVAAWVEVYLDYVEAAYLLAQLSVMMRVMAILRELRVLRMEMLAPRLAALATSTRRRMWASRSRRALRPRERLTLTLTVAANAPGAAA